LPHGGKNPIRIILDRSLRTPETAHVITDEVVETIIFTLDSERSETAFSEYPLVTVVPIPEEVDFLEEVLVRLANKGIMTLFVEGGSRVHTSFINADLADELYLYMAPKLIGNGSSLFMDDTRNFMAESESLRIVDVQQIGEDIRLHAQFLKEE
jgi:diaminohydroxyphosphoribosylaminopyrimidine deaminase/5-amino-6-(5-phosphoribosylamino)uracil reductase